MAKKVATGDFIKKAKEIHGDKYDYSKVEYKKSSEKVCIICPEHGEFWQVPCSHLKGCGCFKCGVEQSANGHKSYTEEFIEKARKTHGDKYDYSKVEYNKSSKNVIVKCNKCGTEFPITPNRHLNGQGCPICANNKKRSLKKNTKSFIEKAKVIHNNKYDYSKTIYSGSNKKVCIICPEHGEFWQNASNHLRGNGCPKCGRSKVLINNTSSVEEFISKAKQIHCDKYDYSKVKYKNANTKVCIVCPEHGEFWQRPCDHLYGQGCPICNESKLEKQISTLLSENNIKFISQCGKNIFNWLDRQSLDFYLPDYNIAIECQGEQHFISMKHFGGDKEFSKIIKRDNEKLKKCQEHGINLLYFAKQTLSTPYGVITDKNELIKLLDKCQL